MSHKHTLSRSLHDVGLATWFGGSLMGAVGLNGATAHAAQPTERTRLSSLGWARWAPVNTAAIGAHVLGSLGQLTSNSSRLSHQPGARTNAVAKTTLTAVAVGLTTYAGYLGRQVAQHADEGSEGATEPRPGASADLQTAQQRLKLAQWAIPAVTGVLEVLSAQQGEQQRPQSLVRGHRDILSGR